MPAKAHAKIVSERALDAEVKASQWLADGNQAREAGQAQCMRDGLVKELLVKDYYEQAYDEARLSAVAAVWDATESLTPENIKSTVMQALHRAFSRIRMFAQDDPALAGLIADVFHNLPDALENWSHDALRQEAIRALHALTIKPQLKGK